MTGQLTIDWDIALPVSGRTPSARHASATGARKAAADRGALSLRYRELLIAAGPLSDDECAKILARPVSSMCSVRNGWGDHVVESGTFQTVTWANGWTSKRTRWRWQG